jgi:hypothetical protein
MFHRSWLFPMKFYGVITEKATVLMLNINSGIYCLFYKGVAESIYTGIHIYIYGIYVYRLSMYR